MKYMNMSDDLKPSFNHIGYYGRNMCVQLEPVYLWLVVDELFGDPQIINRLNAIYGYTREEIRGLGELFQAELDHSETNDTIERMYNVRHGVMCWGATSIGDILDSLIYLISDDDFGFFYAPLAVRAILNDVRIMKLVIEQLKATIGLLDE